MSVELGNESVKKKHNLFLNSKVSHENNFLWENILRHIPKFMNKKNYTHTHIYIIYYNYPLITIIKHFNYSNYIIITF